MKQYLYSISRIKFCLTGMFLLAGMQSIYANDDISYVSEKNGSGSFALASNGKPVPLYADSSDYAGVVRAAKNLQADIGLVTNFQPAFSFAFPSGKLVVLIGTLGKSVLIDKLVAQKKLNVTGIAGKWETFLIQTVENPVPGVDRALVIAGSDKRGTIFGIYDLSAQIGVSPWYWWADVPVKKKSNIYVLAGRHTTGTPAVKYRGIFINDEAPAFSGWAREKFGGINSKVYEKVFELILRLKGNYLWPAMWGNAFNDDDKLSPELADEYGIVMGTSHHEPMMRAQQEWKRYGKGEWNYDTNPEVLREFWRQGIENNSSRESIVTLAMRGDGDMAMTQGTNVALLERIVNDQRKILAEVTGKDITTIPQVWALYKEVQDYYDRGMRVPDDVTLLLCDDNWGNVRKLPKPDDPPRKGGYGMYYHFDFVGGPRNYKWLNTVPIAKVWEQMNLAYDHGVDRIWVVNVGDIKPEEFPIEFFLDLAWNPKKWPADRLQEYTRLWAKNQFGSKYAAEIADIISKYTKYNGRRKPEMLAPETYSLANYREAETIVEDFNKIKARAQEIYKTLPSDYKDAYYQLVLHQVEACANLNELYVSTAKNRLYAQQGRATANVMATKVKELFIKDSLISVYYNKTMAGGKWNHMMDQTHIGYTSWQEPRTNTMPAVRTIGLPEAADMGVGIEGSTLWWPNATAEAVLPEFNSYQESSYYIDVFNRGKASFDYTVKAGATWVHVSANTGKISDERRLLISVDWTKAPKGIQKVPVTISGPNGREVVVQAVINNTAARVPENTFVQTSGYISIEAEHFTKAVNTSGIKWKVLPDHGRTLSAVTTFPVTVPRQEVGKGPRLEYQIMVSDTGNVTVQAYFSPVIDFYTTDGLRYAVSIDDEEPKMVNLHPNRTARAPEQDNVAEGNSIKTHVSQHKITIPGIHVLKYWMIDPAVVLQKIVVDVKGVKPSYLGPPESFYNK